eukprot:6484416-Amphidinium_carterae.1
MDTLIRAAGGLKSDQWEGEAEAQNIVVGADVADYDNTAAQNEIAKSAILTLPGPEWFPGVTAESYDFGTHRPKDILPIWCAVVTLNLSLIVKTHVKPS